jgi:hypothetical protein
MATLRKLGIAAAMVAFAWTAAAQPRAAAPASGPAASAPRSGMGMGGGDMGMHRRAMRPDAGNTSGWGMMTPQERQEHRQHMADFKTYDECHAYMEKHHAEMVDRAKQRGIAAPGQPRDMCAGLK